MSSNVNQGFNQLSDMFVPMHIVSFLISNVIIFIIFFSRHVDKSLITSFSNTDQVDENFIVDENCLTVANPSNV